MTTASQYVNFKEYGVATMLSPSIRRHFSGILRKLVLVAAINSAAIVLTLRAQYEDTRITSSVEDVPSSRKGTQCSQPEVWGVEDVVGFFSRTNSSAY